mmetsp:Transcript_74533/g.207087  ORF Transcript_74533/g.207087 Transcript_74533/m.207087 type:complete len:519 (-) Transcript_74533:86-1642(-)
MARAPPPPPGHSGGETPVEVRRQSPAEDGSGGGGRDGGGAVKAFVRRVVAAAKRNAATGLQLPQAARRVPTSIAVRALACALTAFAVALFARRARGYAPPARRSVVLPVSLSGVMRLLADGRVAELIYSDNGRLLARLRRSPAVGDTLLYGSHLLPGSEGAVFAAARRASVICRYTPAPRAANQVFSVALPFIMLFIWYRVMRSLVDRNEKYVPNKSGSHSAPPRVTLADVVCKSKVELAEIVDYLNKPEKYQRAGARLPRGALLVGPSGTGKTLLARAVAGEARCAFVTASASEFVEVFVGRGAARVRDLFRQARKAAPAVLFLDELDAVGSRSRKGFGANEEYVQTLNQLLTELDGFHGNGDGLVVLAATNRSEAIDAALLRPGRFDRHIYIELPDQAERLEILKLHIMRASAAKGLKNSRALARAAEATPGFSGAELANIVNEAVFLALRAGRSQAQPEDVEEAVQRAKMVRQHADTARVAEDGGGTDANAILAAAGMSRALFRPWPAAAARASH